MIVRIVCLSVLGETSKIVRDRNREREHQERKRERKTDVSKNRKTKKDE